MGIFITFEGGEGSGKSTIIQKFKKSLDLDRKLPADCGGHKDLPETVLIREPGGTPIGNQIRAVLLNSENKNMSHKTELLLYQAARAQLLEETIIPALEEGKIVISDRFMDSTRVYQGMARGFGKPMVDWFDNFVVGFYPPDITFLLDVDPKVGLERSWKVLNEMSQVTNIDEARFEKESVEFHERVRQGYLTLAKLEPNRFVVIDTTNRDENQVCAAVSLAFNDFLSRARVEELSR